MITLEAYPDRVWRPHQRDYAELVRAVAVQTEQRRVGLEGPCGCGKSIGYLRALLDPASPPSIVCTTTRQHLKQLEETLERYWPSGDEWLVLRGRDHYGCCKSPRPAPGEDQDPAEVWASAGAPGQCPLGLECRYRAAVIAAGQAKVVVQCTIGALYRRRFWSQLPEPGEDATPEQRELHEARQSILNRSVAVLDEAHEYLRVRREFETDRLSVWPARWTQSLQKEVAAARMKFGGYKASAVLLKRNAGLGLKILCAFMAELEPANMARELDQQEAAAKRTGRAFVREEAEKRTCAMWQTRIDLINQKAEDPKFDPVLYLAFDGLKCQLTSEPLFVNTKDRFAAREIYTSATLKGVSGLLGIDNKEWLHCFPSIFARDAIDPMPFGDNADGGQKNVPFGPDELGELYDSADRPLTICLFLSKKAAHDAAKHLAKRPGVFIQGLNASAYGDDEEMSLGEMVSRVKQAAAEGAAPFLVCYGGWVGTDIPGDKWLVIGQAPKTPIAPYIEERQSRRMGGGWSDYEKITLDRLQLAQGLGRALRTSEDRAVVIWPDNQAFRQLGLDPKTGHLR